jgi:glycosyltransferase involved in cell wall biosynthesis
MNPPPLITALVAVYNEEKHLERCLETLLGQSYQPLEVIVADDGSTDRSVEVAGRYAGVRLLRLPHAGKARAMNAAAREARGEILLFLDGDLSFDREYVRALVGPILRGEGVGSCHATERVQNPQNRWSRCWQISAGLTAEYRVRLTPEEIAAGSIIFRALRRDAFLSVGGFDDTGHTDDHTLNPKLGRKAVFVPEAICYHYNVETLAEVFAHGVWGGKSIHHRWGSRALASYFPPRSLLRAVWTAIRHRNPALAVYTTVAETGIFWGVFKRTLHLDRTYGR